MKINSVNSLAYLAVAVFIYAVMTKLTDNPAIFLNVEGMVIVIGGMGVATLASFPFQTLKDTYAGLYFSLVTPVKMPTEDARQIVRMALVGQRGFARLESELDHIDNTFLRSGTELILEGVKTDVFMNIMHKRIYEYQERVSRGTNVLLTMSKFSPALGLAATVLGLVQLLEKLQTADLATLGTGMAIALTATFYGIVLANLVLQPLAELLQTRADLEIKTREMVVEGLMAILERREPLVIGEVVNSYLPDQHRIKFSEEMETLSQDRSGKPREAAA